MTKKQRQKALWQELLGRNPSVKDLLKVAEHMPTLRIKVWQEISNWEITDEDLRYAMQDCGLANEAGQQLLEQNPSKENLLIIVELYTGTISDKAAQGLIDIKQKLKDNELGIIVRFGKEFFSDEAGEELLEREANREIKSNENFRYMIKYGGKFLRNKVGEELLGRNPSNYDLFFIMRDCKESLGDEAWQKLITQDPNKEDLLYIIRGSPRFKDKAQKLLNRSNSNIIAEMQMLDEGLWLRFKAWVAKHW